MRVTNVHWLMVTGVAIMAGIVDSSGADEERPPARQGSGLREDALPEKDRQMIALGRTDFPAALSAIAANYPPDEQTRAKVRLLAILGQGDFHVIARIPDVLEWDASIPGVFGQDGSTALAYICADWVAKDEPAIIRYALELPESETKYRLLMALARRVSSFKVATDLISHVPPGKLPIGDVVNFAINYHGKNTDELFSWASSLPGPAAGRVFLGLVHQFDFRKDEANLRKIAKLAPVFIRPVALESLGRAVGKSEGGNVLERLQSFELNKRETEQAIIGSLTSAPSELLAPLMEVTLHSDDPGIRRSAISKYVFRLAGRNPQKAVGWVLSLPWQSRRDGIQALVGTWVSVNVQAALDWVRSLADDADRDAGLAAFALGVRNGNPLAREAALEIRDEKLREVTLLNIGERPGK
jgi:hypothetical protein